MGSLFHFSCKGDYARLESMELYYFSYYRVGAGYYDADIGLWTSVDPMREYSSGYTYVGNNPIIKIDPDGMQSRYPSVGGSITGPVGNSFSTTGPVQRPNQSPPLSDYAWGNLNATYGLISGAGATATGIGITLSLIHI